MSDVAIGRAGVDDVRSVLRRRKFDEASLGIALRSAERGTAWVARDDGEIIGVALAQSTEGERYVGECFVEPSYRGHGIGLRLIQATLAQAQVAGFVRVELDVHADNARAITLYEKVGFVREGVARDAVFVDGEYRDAINMAIVDRGNAA